MVLMTPTAPWTPHWEPPLRGGFKPLCPLLKSLYHVSRFADWYKIVPVFTSDQLSHVIQLIIHARAVRTVHSVVFGLHFPADELQYNKNNI